jgi:hypothetical protein
MRLQRTASLAVFAALGCFILAPGSGCSSSSKGTNATTDDGGSSSGDDATTCIGLASCNNGGTGAGGDDSGIYKNQDKTCGDKAAFQCQQMNCSGNATTSIHGTVFDPAGQLPLFNVAVYVPNEPPIDLPEGVSCANCQTWYTAPVVSTLTDAGGNFTLTNMPVGQNIPLIVQVGKWRMVYTLSNIKPCVDNGDAAALVGSKLRLPKNHTEGHIPNIAISTGALDSLECLIRRVGIDANEYTGNPTTSPAGPRIHIFTGGNAPASMGGAQTNNPKSMQSYQYLWNNDTNINQFDVVLLACEGTPTSYLNAASQSVLQDYANGGGRVFASHYHYAWFNTGPFAMTTPPLATWSPDGVAGKSLTVGPNGDNGFVYGDVIQTLPNGMPFPEGTSLHQWLTNVQALMNDKLPIWYARHNADLSAANTASQAWIQLDPSVTDAPNAAEYFSFDTPVGTGKLEQCGRVVFSDLHVSGGIGSQNEPGVMPDYPGGLAITPDGCASHPLTAQEKALEFMLFDLSSCLQPIGMVNMPPQPK